MVDARAQQTFIGFWVGLHSDADDNVFVPCKTRAEKTMSVAWNFVEKKKRNLLQKESSLPSEAGSSGSGPSRFFLSIFYGHY
ncbi:hypothetical protein ACLOJK_024453 [Asimina triloba]